MVFFSCNLINNGYGKKLTFGNHEVYYKGEGVSESDARKLGEYLEEQEWFDKDGDRKSAQLTHDGEDYLVHLVVKDGGLTDAKELAGWKLQSGMSEELFNGKPVRIVWANTDLKDVEILNPVARYKAGKLSVYYDNSAVRKSEAKKLADFLIGSGIAAKGKAADVFYQNNGSPVVRIVYDESKYTKQAVKGLSYVQDLMRERVFDGEKAKLVLMTARYQDLKPLPKLTPEERAQFDGTETKEKDQPVLDSTTVQTTVSGVERIRD